jgi:cytochrome c553
MNVSRNPLLFTALFAGVLCAVPSARSQEGVDFFERKIRPVLVQHCYSCHSVEAKKNKGDLYVDSKDGLLQGGETGPAIVPGKPDKSLLIKAIRYTDPVLKMPRKEKLSEQVIADFEKWIAMGAPDPRTASGAKIVHKYPTVEEGRKFWAFQPVKMPMIPKVKDAAWPKSDIDRFLLGKMEEKNLKPSRDADRGTLLRRLYFAIIGMPPTPAEIDAFVNDRSPDAIIHVVDRLLASPHFGERWGRHWLDVARFAESSGGGRTALFKDAWRYRDYVISSFNSDKPFTQFIIEQLAGDLQDARTPEERYWQLVATAFLLLGPTNFERQDKPSLEMDVIDEQIDTMGKGFLGMTIGCARCHDHKFDPIPTKDYYALAGIFKSTKFIVHSNVSKWMERPLPSPDPNIELTIKKHDAAVASLKKQIAQVKAKNPLAGVVTEPIKGTPIAAKDLPGIVIDDTQARKVGAWKHSTFTGNYIGEGYLYDDRAMKGEKTLTFQPEFTESGIYEVRLAYIPHSNRADKVEVRIFHREGDDTVYVNQKLQPPIDGRFVSLGRYRFTKGNQWFVMVSTDGANGHVVADAVQFLPEALADRQPAKAPALALGAGATLADLEARLKQLEKQAPERAMAMAVAEGDRIADMHVCIRGIVHNKGEMVSRGFLQVATRGSMPKIGAKDSGRRELAAWVASPDNPLTARVYVNRVWHHLFGSGLVRTVDNFGATGETPSHPELLDYLAMKFSTPDQPGAQATGGFGWSTKKLIRAIVLSHAYQMSSEPSADGIKADPENRLVWRMNRQRLEAEALRDAILCVSGQLDRATLGNTIKKGTIAERDYVFDDVRRSVYTPVFRNRLLEMFEVFDFPDPNMALGKRNVSTVPTQALFMMNSPFVMTQARHAATQSLKLEMKDPERIDDAYRKTLGRLPTMRERELALAYLSVPLAEQRPLAWERFYQTLFACVDFRYVN